MSKVFIIAEAGVNHNGRLDLALSLCDEAKGANVDAIKFQTYRTENIVTKTSELAVYQKVNCGNNSSQFEMLKKLELDFETFVTIKNYCDKIGIEFLSTPDDEESLDFLVNLGLTKLKIGSGDVNNLHYLRNVASKGLEVILSTGMSYLKDVENAYYTLLSNGAKGVSLLHCTTNYPCPFEEVNLNAMLTMKQCFKAVVGYSDHTLGIEVPTAAVALGAEIIEKHFTLDKTMEGPDHKASLDPFELGHMVNSIRNIEKAKGDGLKRPNQSEIQIASVVKKNIVAKVPIKFGEILTFENLCFKRTSQKAISCESIDLLIGSKARKNYMTDEAISV